MLAQSSVHVDYSCPAEDIETFGLTCSEDRPCPVFFEVSAVDSIGPQVFVAGDIHTSNTTLYGVVLSTDDGGVTWNEAIARMRSTAFDHFQVIDNHGWLSGQKLEPLPKEPFLLLTSDAGKTWRQKPLFEETRFGSITQFWFDSSLTGELVFDHSVGKSIQQELYDSKSGGESWEMKQASTKPLQLAGRAKERSWTIAAPTGSAYYLIEHTVAGKKAIFARFLIHIGDCK